MSAPTPLRVGIDVSAIPANPAGAGRYVLELVRALAVRPDVALVCFARRDDASRWAAVAPSPGAVVARAPTSRPARILDGELLLGRRVRHTRPPVAVLHGPHYSLPRTRAAPEVVTVHDLTLVEHPEWHERAKVRFFTAAMRRAATRADAIIVLSLADKERFSERFSPRGELVVIAHGVDPDRFCPSEPSLGADAAVLRRLGVAAPYLLHLGTIEPRKNLPVLVHAFERLADAAPELHLVLAGTEGWGAGALTETLRRSRAAERVLRLGYVGDGDVPALVRGAAAVAYPSSAEGFGLPVLEALACGAPTVTTTGSVMATLAGGAAVLAPAGDPDALAQALREARSGGESAAARRELGLRRAAAYSWQECAAAHLETYRRVASVAARLT